ncbi:YkvA family protein [Rossellomorea vietnamensis]|uniref:YkvA family protein n=1 Tax=Rossellomorea vietnamensis TaxID=218284 RepID=UPI003D2B041A
MNTLKKLKSFAKKLKQDLLVLYLSYKDPRTPMYAKVLAMCVVAYAFSPIDLIPDFIPIIGYLDDLILVPFGIFLALRVIPSDVLEEKRKMAINMKKKDHPKNWFVGVIFILIWILLAVWAGKLLVGLFS